MHDPFPRLHLGEKGVGWEEGLYLGLEGGVEVSEEGVVPGQGQHPLLHHRALYVVVHQHHVFLQGLHGEVLTLPLQLRQQYLVGQGRRGG